MNRQPLSRMPLYQSGIFWVEAGGNLVRVDENSNRYLSESGKARRPFSDGSIRIIRVGFGARAQTICSYTKSKLTTESLNTLSSFIKEINSHSYIFEDVSTMSSNSFALKHQALVHLKSLMVSETSDISEGS